MTFLNMLLLMDVLLEKRKENNKKEVLSCSCAHQSRQMRLIWQRDPSLFQWVLRHRDSGGNNTEICPIPRPGPGSANICCSSLFTAFGWEKSVLLTDSLRVSWFSELPSPSPVLSQNLIRSPADRGTETRPELLAVWGPGWPGLAGCLTTLNSTRKLRDSQN